MQTYAIIVAGGSGKRFGGEIPKQFVPLAGKPILMHTIESVFSYNSEIHIIVVLPNEQIPVWEEMCQEAGFQTEHDVVAGGSERFFSVKNAIEFLSKKQIDPNDLVAIHDGVRPFANRETWQRSLQVAKVFGNAVPCMPVVESLRAIEGDRSKHLDRTNIRTIQTPQVFRFGLLEEAYRQEFSREFTDDASVVERLGEKIVLTEGNTENIKITTPFDLIVGEAIFDNLGIEKFRN